jgi:dUTP pyrophosphatase
MYKTQGSVAADLVANIPPNDIGERIIRLAPGHIEVIDAGFCMALPPGWEAQIRCRSSMAQKGVQVTNGIGTIDSDYRGRIMVVLNNAGREIVNIKHGERFAQMSIKPVFYFAWNIVNELDDTERGEGGFGSTGQ